MIYQYELENTKPLFKYNGILTVQNLYNYHVILQTSKIIQFRQPYSMFSKFIFLSSKTKHNILIPPLVRLDKRKQSFFFSASCRWNQINELLNIDLNSPFTAQRFKVKLKGALLKIQECGSEVEWEPRNHDISLNVGAAQFRYTPT